MFEFVLHKEIPAPLSTVWDVIVNTDDYPLWNRFILECESTFVQGAAIKMKVRILPSVSMTQTETIRRVKEGHFIDYGIQWPWGLLSSSRQHILTPIGQNLTKYESVFRLEGLLSNLVGSMLGKQLRIGFGEMTDGIAVQAQERAERRQNNRAARNRDIL